MPAKSKKQQRFFGMVHAVQKGEMAAPSDEVAQVAGNISKSDAEEFASTEHKGLPEKKGGVSDMPPKTAVTKMAAYIRYLAEKNAQREPTEKDAMEGEKKGKKKCGSDRLSKLAEALEANQNIFAAVRKVYPTKSAAYHYKVVQGLVHGFRAKLAQAQKRAMLTGATGHPSASVGAPGRGMPGGAAAPAPSGSRMVSMGPAMRTPASAAKASTGTAAGT